MTLGAGRRIVAHHGMEQPRLQRQRLAQRRALRAKPAEIGGMLGIARDGGAAHAVRPGDDAAADAAIGAGGAHRGTGRGARSSVDVRLVAAGLAAAPRVCAPAPRPWSRAVRGEDLGAARSRHPWPCGWHRRRCRCARRRRASRRARHPARACGPAHRPCGRRRATTRWRARVSAPLAWNSSISSR